MAIQRASVAEGTVGGHLVDSELRCSQKTGGVLELALAKNIEQRLSESFRNPSAHIRTATSKPLSELRAPSRGTFRVTLTEVMIDDVVEGAALGVAGHRR